MLRCLPGLQAGLVRSETAFAALARASPIPASSGQVTAGTLAAR
jgi:hypothetical protein